MGNLCYIRKTLEDSDNVMGRFSKTDYIEPTLTRAIYDGNIEHVKLFLDQGVDPENPECENALILAVEGGHKDIVRMLLDHGTSCNKAKSDGKTPLVLAAENGYTHVVKMLLDCGALYKIKYSQWKKMLHRVTKRDDIDILKMLINHDRDYNRNKSIDHLLTPLMWATYRGITDVVKSLLEHGADCNRVNSNGETPLFIAVRGGYTDVVALLLEHGSDCNRVNSDGKTPLFIAVERGGYTDVVSPLLEHGADCNRVNLNGETPLIQALKRDNIHIVKKLLPFGSDCTEVNPFAYRAVQIAARRGQLDDIFHVIRMMLAYDRNIQNIDGYKSLRRCLGVRDYRLYIHDILKLINLMYWSGMCHQSDLFKIFHDSDIMETLREDPDIIKWLKEKCESPMTLQNITRIFIYKKIQINRDDNIHKLPIPSQLKNFLQFPNLGDDKVEYSSYH